MSDPLQKSLIKGFRQSLSTNGRKLIYEGKTLDASVSPMEPDKSDLNATPSDDVMLEIVLLKEDLSNIPAPNQRAIFKDADGNSYSVRKVYPAFDTPFLTLEATYREAD